MSRGNRRGGPNEKQVHSSGMYRFACGIRLNGWEIGNRPGSLDKRPPNPKKEHVVNDLTPRERELVAIGAAMGSNCVPCIEYHIPEARKAGLADSQIAEAVRIADRVRQVPARKVLNAALSMLPETSAGAQAGDGDCVAAASTAGAGARCCG
jgi:AhpD family alkylhydroperoxidase